jgi:hypothetical protein
MIWIDDLFGQWRVGIRLESNDFQSSEDDGLLRPNGADQEVGPPIAIDINLGSML